jgi:CcmD family protein
MCFDWKHRATPGKDKQGQSKLLITSESWERSMKNMNVLVAAYVAIWAIFCLYLFTVARRMASLQDDIRRLKQGGK